MFWLYNLILLFSIPLFPAVKFAVKKRGEVSLLPRLRTSFPGGEGKVLLHASSVGEVNAVKPLVEKLTGRVALTTFTDYGLKRAGKLYPDIPKRVIPLDLYPLILSFLKEVKPEKILIYETEIWPSFLRASAELNIPLYFVSGKLGDKSYRRLKRFSFLKPYLERCPFLARSSEDAERARELGFKEVSVVGDLKLDYTPPEKFPPLEIEGKRRVVLWGSTHPGEEEIAVRLHFKLKERFPDLLTVIAPRHVGRKVELPGRVLRRSESPRVPREVDFYLVDTIGELSGLYHYADVSLIGGSFVPGIGGHNPVESVALKKPTLMGEHATAFKELALQLKVPLLKRRELLPFLTSLLSRQELSSNLAETSFKLWTEKRGVSERILSYIGE
ncbi:3-deoxy-D-manno-octulosonic acid transferase [Thermovibrio sp.]